MANKILDRLESQRRETMETLADLSDEALDRSVDGAWTVRDVLTHLLNAEEDHCRVISVALRGDLDRLPSDFDIDSHNQERLDERGALELEELVGGLATQRQRTLELYRRVGSDRLDTPVPHPALGNTTVGKIFRIIGLHEKMHLKQINDALET